MRIGPLLQYFCSSCGKILKENTTLEFQQDQLNEECPGCGALLINTLQNRRKVYSSLLEQEHVSTSAADKPSRCLSVDFNTAYRQIEDRSIHPAFDIEKIDSLLNLNARGSLCIIGDQRYAQLLINRLCVHSLLPRRHGGIGSNDLKIIVIDAGNCTDVYQFVDFARQYGLEIKKVLRNIVVSRVFTIYQFAHLVVYELPKVIEQLSSNKKNNFIVVVYDLLARFMSDPHIDKVNAIQLIKEIASSIRKLSKDRFVIASFLHSNYTHEKWLMPVFDNMIEIANEIEKDMILRVKVSSHTSERRKPVKQSINIKENQLQLVPPI
jgi:DNA-directed RNA polymerase subunit RPC12/RpoP